MEITSNVGSTNSLDTVKCKVPKIPSLKAFSNTSYSNKNNIKKEIINFCEKNPDVDYYYTFEFHNGI